MECITERRRRMLAEKGEKNREEEVCEEEATIWMKDEDLRMRFVLFKLRISLLCQKMSGRRWQPGEGGEIEDKESIHGKLEEEGG